AASASSRSDASLPRWTSTRSVSWVRLTWASSAWRRSRPLASRCSDSASEGRLRTSRPKETSDNTKKIASPRASAGVIVAQGRTTVRRAGSRSRRADEVAVDDRSLPHRIGEPILPRADLHDRGLPVLAPARDAVAVGERLSRLGDGGELRFRQPD